MVILTNGLGKSAWMTVDESPSLWPTADSRIAESEISSVPLRRRAQAVVAENWDEGMQLTTVAVVIVDVTVASIVVVAVFSVTRNRFSIGLL